MQEFDPVKHPNLCSLDKRVAEVLASPKAQKWDTPRREYEICRMHPVYYMEQYAKIRPGELELGPETVTDSDGLIPFRLNPVQLLIADRVCCHYLQPRYTRVMVLVLKHRKAGISTLFAGFDAWHMRFFDNTQAFAIADLGSHTDNIVEMVRIILDHDTCGRGASGAGASRFWPIRRRPMPMNKKGLRYSNSSMMEQDSGDNSNPGTSGTVTVVHMSENAKWRDPKNAETSLLNSVPRRGYAFIVKESTAFGINKFAEDVKEAQKGLSTWEFVFISWLDMPDCCDDYYPGEQLVLDADERELKAAYPQMNAGHIKFRRRQIDFLGSASLFRQDFPLNPREPFLVTGANYFNVREVEERREEIKFYRMWKEKGVDVIKEHFPEMLVRIKHHPSGQQAALANIEDRCVIPALVTLTDNETKVSYIKDPNARMEDGAAMMFREPRRGRQYLVTIDVAEGIQVGEYTSDNSIVEVIDCWNREQVCEWGGVFDEEITAHYAVMLARVYNNAFICPEMNNKCGGLLWGYLEKSKYKRLYYREVVRGNHREREKGWETKVGSKKEVLGRFKVDFKNRDCTIHSLDLLEEMLFFMDARGKLEAAEGKLDDRVIAYGIGLQVIHVTPELRRRPGEVKDRVPSHMGIDVPSTRSPTSHARRSEAIRRYM